MRPAGWHRDVLEHELRRPHQLLEEVRRERVDGHRTLEHVVEEVEREVAVRD